MYISNHYLTLIKLSEISHCKHISSCFVGLNIIAFVPTCNNVVHKSVEITFTMFGRRLCHFTVINYSILFRGSKILLLR